MCSNVEVIKKIDGKKVVFDVSYVVRFCGECQSPDFIITPQMVRDQIIYTLEDLIHKKHISTFKIEMAADHLKRKKK